MFSRSLFDSGAWENMEDSTYLKITIPKGKQVRCKVVSSGMCPYKQCGNCGDLTETALILACGHNLCEGCSATFSEFICAKDSVLTRKHQAKRDTPYCDPNSHTVCLECPTCCNFSGNVWNMKEHIKRNHPEALREAPREGFQEVSENVWNFKPESQSLDNVPGDSDGVPARMKSADVLLTGQHHGSQEKQQLICTYDYFNPHSTDSKILAVSHSSGDTHVQGTATSPTLSAPASRGDEQEEGEGGCEWSKKTKEDIRVLLENARELEKRLDNIEAPTKELIERLLQCS